MAAVDPAQADLLAEMSRRLQTVVTEAINAECDRLLADDIDGAVVAAAACNAAGGLLANALASQIEPMRRARISRQTLRFVELAVEDSLLDQALPGALLQ